MPRAPLPGASVTRARVVSRTTSKGITPPSSLLRAHAPDHLPPPDLRVPHLYPAVFAGCGQPLLEGGPSRRCAASLSQDAWAQIPAGRRVHMPVSSPTSSAFPKTHQWVGFPHQSAQRLQSGGSFEIVAIPYVQASWFVRHPGLPYRYGITPQGSRDFYARARHAPSPGRASGMLAVRTRQLTAEDLHLMRLAALSAAPGTFTRKRKRPAGRTTPIGE